MAEGWTWLVLSSVMLPVEAVLERGGAGGKYRGQENSRTELIIDTRDCRRWCKVLWPAGLAVELAVVLGRRRLLHMEEMQGLLQGQTTIERMIANVRIFLNDTCEYLTPSSDT